MAQIQAKSFRFNKNYFLSICPDERMGARLAIINREDVGYGFFEKESGAINCFLDAFKKANLLQIKHDKLDRYISENIKMLQFSMFLALMDLTANAVLPKRIVKEKNGIKKIDKIIKLAHDFYEIVPKVDHTKLAEARSPDEYLYRWLTLTAEERGTEYSDEMNRWSEKIEYLNEIIQDLKNLKKIMTRRPRGRTNILDSLTAFCLEVIALYEYVLERKFTIDKLNKNEPTNPAMHFMFSVVDSLYIYENNKERYTPQNIFNASSEALKIIRSSSSKKCLEK